MARTSPELVRGIIPVDASIALKPFIDTASILVDRVIANDSEGVHTKASLELLERWIAAHAYASHPKGQLYASKQTGRASAVFQGKTNMYLEGTTYGQMAISLDGTGYLANLGANTASVLWGGIEYDDAPQPPGNNP